MSVLLDALLASADRHDQRIALDDGANTFRYADLRRAVRSMAQMIGDEVSAAGPVSIELDNGIDWVIADLALLSLGRPSIPLPPFFMARQVEAALNDAGAAARLTQEGIVRLDSKAAAIPAGTAKISYTSGSTGTPKGICLSDRQLLETGRAVVTRLGADIAGSHLPALPLGVLLENVAGLYATLLAGGCYSVRRLGTIGLANPFRLDSGALVDAIRRIRATSLILVPDYLAQLVARLEQTGERLSSLKLVAVGGARVPVSLLDRAQSVGLPVVQGYGLTECGSVVALEAVGDRNRGTVGTALGHASISLASDGEIIVGGHFHLGTVGHPRADAPVHTGDLGEIDDKGRLSIIGRKSNLIITSFGRNVAPEWVEEQLLAHPQIAQAMVYGDGASELNAFVVPSALDADVAAAIATANAALPAYARVGPWQPSRPFTPGDGTLTANGRLRRDAILHRAATRPFFERLVAETAPARARLLAVPQLKAGFAGRISRDTYLDYLAEAYHHVRHTVPLMKLARARLTSKPALAHALDDYIAEEDGHEQWILNDIRAAGGDPEAAIERGPSVATARMVDHAYHVLRTANPAAFFGMVFVLEGTSTALASNGADAVKTSLGLPAEAFTYLTSHGALDQDHMKFFETVVNAIDDRDDQDAIVEMATAMFDLFAGVFAGIAMEDVHAAA